MFYGEGDLNVYFLLNKIILPSIDKIEDVTLHIFRKSQKGNQRNRLFRFLLFRTNTVP